MQKKVPRRGKKKAQEEEEEEEGFRFSFYEMTELDKQLYSAVEQGQSLEQIQELLKRGANPNSGQDNGSIQQHAIHVALGANNLELIKALLGE